MQNRPRISIWSVQEDWQQYYLVLFSIQFVSLAGLVIWHEIKSSPSSQWPEIIIGIGRGIAPWTVVLAAETIIVTEILVLVSDWVQKRRYNRGRTEGRSTGSGEL
jgi:ABC-type antimicrobial peptide transport system permease subunit